jgi:flagellar biosynthesis GTPase FlhF
MGLMGWVLSAMLVSGAMAGTIYTWTDADGVKRYSNAQPPEGAENVKTIDEVQSRQDDNSQIRQEYDRMVDEASQEADQHFEKQSEKKARARDTEKQRGKEQRNQQLEQERQKLLKEIDALRNRGLSATFSEGQREYLIKQIQDQIDQIDEKRQADLNR